MSSVGKQQAKVDKAALNLSRKRDRVQATSTSALSVSLVVVLKTIIDSGPDGIDYYAFSLLLVVAAMGLQIAIGVVLVYMSTVSSRLSEIAERASVTAAMTSYGPTTDISTSDKDTAKPTTPATTYGSTAETDPEHSGVDDESAEKKSSTLTPQEMMQVLINRFRDQSKVLSDAELYLASLDPSDKDAIAAAKKDVLIKTNIVRATLRHMKLLDIVVDLSMNINLTNQLNQAQGAVTYLLYATVVFNTFLVAFGTVTYELEQ